MSCEQAEACPGCGQIDGVEHTSATTRVEAWRCTRCGISWACTAVNPHLRVALSIVGLLPTPALRTAALLAVLRTEVTQRAQTREHTMAETVCLPATEVISIDAMASVDTVVWWCRMCDHHGTATTRPAAHSDGVEHLVDKHRATIGSAP